MRSYILAESNNNESITIIVETPTLEPLVTTESIFLESSETTTNTGVNDRSTTEPSTTETDSSSPTLPNVTEIPNTSAEPSITPDSTINPPVPTTVDNSNISPFTEGLETTSPQIVTTEIQSIPPIYYTTWFPDVNLCYQLAQYLYYCSTANGIYIVNLQQNYPVGY